MENELFYEPDDAFWEKSDKLAFESVHLVAEWPKPLSPFISRMANPSTMERGLHHITLPVFKQLIGLLIQSDAHAVYRFEVIPMGRNGRTLSIRLLEKVASALPPLRSENACALQMAIEWLAKRHSHFQISCAAGANFWIRKQ